MFRNDAPTLVRDDIDVPVVMVQTETDVTGRLRYLPARQPDTDLIRLWEVAGTAHADRYQIGEFEELLGCPRPVNRGQQAYVVRAGLRWLDSWARGGDAPPSAARLETADWEFVLDEAGNAHGGVRTPVVDVPVELLRGDTEADAPVRLPAVRQHAPDGPGCHPGAVRRPRRPTWRRTRRRRTRRSTPASCCPRIARRCWPRRVRTWWTRRTGRPDLGQWSGQVMSGCVVAVR